MKFLKSIALVLVWLAATVPVSAQDSRNRTAVLDDNPHIPPVVLTDFEFFNRSVKFGAEDSLLKEAVNLPEEVTLRHNRAVFTSTFAARNFTSPEKNRSAYKLEGFDSDWNYTEAARQFATYTNLDPRTYLFLVGTSNNDGLRKDDGRSLKIDITSPWWQTWWFRTLVVIGVVGVFVLGYQLRVRNIEERERRFRTLAENAPDVVARFGRDLRYRYINPAAKGLTGLSPESFIGKTTSEVGLRTDNVNLWDDGLRAVFERGQGMLSEFDYTTPKGVRSFESYLVPELTAGKALESVLVITRDITERKLVQEQMRLSLKEKELLLKEIHHRVKNNLQVISSLLSLQAESLTGGPAYEMLRKSQNRVRSMALIHDRLYRSKDLARLDFSEYISSLAAHLLRSYGGIGFISLRLDVEGVLLNVDTAIPCGLIVNELISNSLKHAFPDGKKGEIHVTMCPHGHNRFLLTVRDDGVGLPDDLDIYNTETLGLQLVNTLTQQLSGKIEIEAKPGSTFKIDFEELKYKERL